MKILLLTDVPPCRNYTAGLVLERLVGFLPTGSLCLCAVVNPEVHPELSAEVAALPRLMLVKPREASLRVQRGALGTVSAYAFELMQGARVRHDLAARVVEFAREQGVDALWVILQGQTMVRLAGPVSQRLGLPLFTQVWDPFGWWLRANGIDGWTTRRLRRQFDKVVARSTACATASWAMATDYNRRYGVRSVPVIAGLPRDLARNPATMPRPSGDFVIALAGQFYAEAEWDCLIHTLNLAKWEIAGRRIRVRVLGAVFKAFVHQEANFEYLGWRSQEDTIQLLADADLLYLPYWFSEEYREESSLSFPSKLVTYFAAGRPIFCHAPSYASPATYLREHRAAYLCDSLDPPAVHAVLERAVTDASEYDVITRNAALRFLEDFTVERMRATFFDFLGREA